MAPSTPTAALGKPDSRADAGVPDRAWGRPGDGAGQRSGQPAHGASASPGRTGGPGGGRQGGSVSLGDTAVTRTRPSAE